MFQEATTLRRTDWAPGLASVQADLPAPPFTPGQFYQLGLRDAKLAALREIIEQKCRNPINVGNRKVIVFTAFADTARYLYEHLAPW
jgi:ERCC4-related helicase